MLAEHCPDASHIIMHQFRILSEENRFKNTQIQPMNYFVAARND